MNMYSCKPAPLQAEPPHQISVENALAEAEFLHIFSSLEIEARKGGNRIGNWPAATSACAEIRIDTLHRNFYRVTIDYGDSCLCEDGRLRFGRIHGFYEGAWPQIDKEMDILFSNYKLIDLQEKSHIVEAHSMKLNYIGLVGNKFPSYKMTVSFGRVATKEGDIKWNTEQTILWIDGLDDSKPNNNVYLINQQNAGSGTSSSGETFEARISTNLICDRGCAFIEKGKFMVTPQDQLPQSLSFGHGTCDNAASITIDGEVENVVLP